MRVSNVCALHQMYMLYSESNVTSCLKSVINLAITLLLPRGSSGLVSYRKSRYFPNTSELCKLGDTTFDTLSLSFIMDSC